jgi:alkylhydroperoxidase/carboxymuconolactone decarboxylase family protein YurZ
MRGLLSIAGLNSARSRVFRDCIISQTSKALELGATADEIFEACAVAISMGGTLAWSKVLVVADYLRTKGIIE